MRTNHSKHWDLLCIKIFSERRRILVAYFFFVGNAEDFEVLDSTLHTSSRLTLLLLFVYELRIEIQVVPPHGI